MKKALFILIITLSPAFADDQKNIYDVFRQDNSDNAIADERTTALIKIDMANLLYPVDMASFVRPEKDAKFREQIGNLQKQMGAPPTGILTSDQFARLRKAASDIHDDNIMPPYPVKKMVFFEVGSVSAVGTGTGDGVANPINVTRIACLKASGTCSLTTAELDQQGVGSMLNLLLPFDYDITSWGPTHVTAISEIPCATAVMSIDIPTKSVTISTVPHSNSKLPFCGNGAPTTWRLADGDAITWKIHQDKVNKARALVYEPERRLVLP
jgi:hypothetical protein